MVDAEKDAESDPTELIEAESGCEKPVYNMCINKRVVDNGDNYTQNCGQINIYDTRS